MISILSPSASGPFPPAFPDDAQTVTSLVCRLVHNASAADLSIRRLGGLHNRSYRVDLGSEILVVRLPGMGTSRDREVEIENAASAAALGLSAPAVFADPAAGVLATRWIEPGTPLRLPVDRMTLEQVGRSLARLHGGPDLRGRFDPLTGLGDKVERVRHQRPTSAAHAIALSHLREVAPELPELCRRLEPASVRPVHGDPTPGNWVDAGSTFALIDWEYSGMGDPLWDLAEFSVTASLTTAQEHVLWLAHEDALHAGGAALAGSPSAGDRDRLRLWKIVCDVVGSVWALDRALEDPAADAFGELARYAHHRAERAITALAGPVAEASLRSLA